MPQKLFLIDGSNHAYRVQYALPPQHASDGFPTRVLYGFTLLFQKMMRTYQPDWCAVSFDQGKSFRSQVYDQYKATRREMPEDMKRQWSSLPKLVEAFGYRCLAVEGYEADDVLATLAVRFASDDLHVYIVTGDKDFGQIVSDKIFLVDDAKGQTLGAPEIKEKLGVPPEQVVDLLALAGDSSDNIPGVPGIGLKTGSQLLETWGTLEAILEAAAAGKIKGKRGEMLVTHAEDARLSKRLATICTDVPLGSEAIDALRPQGVQVDPLRELFDRWEFMDVATRLLPPKVAVDKSLYGVCTTRAEVDELIARVRAAGRCGVAVQGSNARPELAELLGIALALPDLVRYVPLIPRHDLSFDPVEVRAALLAVLADPAIAKVGFDLKADLRLCRRLGSELTGIVGDLKLLDYVLVAHRRTHGLAEIAKRHLGHSVAVASGSEPLMVQDLADFGAEPAHLSLLLHERLDKRLDDGTRFVYEQIEMPLLPVLASMEQAGIKLDLTVMDGIFRDIAARVLAAEKQCHDLLGRPFKVGSPKEVGEILFDELGLAKGKRTKTGYSTDASVLEKMAEEHDLP
ncbi:MAG: DNA polymerase, partial [Myxococcota bacterium]